MRKLVLVGVLAASSFLTPAVASADTINFTGVGRGRAVTIGGLVSVYAFAGEINWNWLEAPGGFSSNIYTYCVDIMHDVISQQTVAKKTTDELTPLTSQSTVAGAGGKVAWLFNEYAAGIHALDLSNGTGLDKAAGLQLAIWETLYDYSAGVYNLGAGNFSVSASTGVLYWANQYLASIGNNTSTAVWFDSPYPPASKAGQDQITQVPEPATLLLFALGIGLAYRFRHRLAPARQIA